MAKEDLEVLEQKIADGEKAERKKRKNAAKEERKAKKKAWRGDFKKFITRGNILDMAIGVMVGSAFTAIITALSNHILKPLINFILASILGEDSLSDVFTFLKKVVAEDGTVDLAQSIYIDWGTFINAIINFLLIAFTLFVLLRIFTGVSKKLDAALHEEEHKKAQAEKEKKDAEDKAKAEKEAEAQRILKEREERFYQNVEEQTALLRSLVNREKQD